jgi:hypothetical protein
MNAFRLAGCALSGGGIATQPWGERMFSTHDPFGNPISFVDDSAFGDEGIRTPDIRVANAALYQLSYVPGSAGRCIRWGWVTFLKFGLPSVPGVLDEQHAFACERFHEELTVVRVEFGRKIGIPHGACLQ